MTDVSLRRVGPVTSLRRPATRAVDGLPEVLALLPELDLLARRCGAPVTARGPWMRARLEADPCAQPWAVTVRSPDGALRAGAVLLDEDGDGPDAAFVLASGGLGYHTGVLATDEDSCRVLGAGIAREAALRAGWRRVDLGPLPDDEVTRVLAEALGAAVVPCDPVPAVRRVEGADLSVYLSSGTRRTLRKAVNRLTSDGKAFRTSFTQDPDAVLAAVPAMEAAYRSRDAEHGLPCPLDAPAGLALWRSRIRHHLDAGCLELAALHIGDAVAAYVLGLLDGRHYRVLEGHFDTRWSRYSPGRLVESAVLRRVVEDDRFDELDWMTSVAPETLLAVNDRHAAVALRVSTALRGARVPHR